MAQERLIFGNSVEGMLRTLPELTPALRAELERLGVTPGKLLPAYDVPTYVKLLDFLGQTRFPSLGPEERDFELGREFIRGFSKTLVGKAALAMTKVLGPLRSTQRLTRTMRSVNNYSQSGATVLGPNSVQIWCAPVLRPHYYRGVFLESGQAIAGPSYTVTMGAFVDERLELQVSWE